MIECKLIYGVLYGNIIKPRARNRNALYINVCYPVVIFEITGPKLAVSLPVLGGRSCGILYALMKPGLKQGGLADFLSMLEKLNCYKMRLDV